MATHTYKVSRGCREDRVRRSHVIARRCFICSGSAHFRRGNCETVPSDTGVLIGLATMKIQRLRRARLWLALALGGVCATMAIRAQGPGQNRFAADQMGTFLYGAAFYEEYMPEDRLEKDVQLMEQAGINVVRVGESTWSLWEPEERPGSSLPGWIGLSHGWRVRISGSFSAHPPIDPAVDVQDAPGNPGNQTGWPKSNLRPSPEYGHHESGFSALFRARHSQDHRTLSRQPGRNRLPGGQ